MCLVSALVSQPVLLWSVLRQFVLATGCGKHLSVMCIPHGVSFFVKLLLILLLLLLLHQTFSGSYTRWCRVELERCGGRRPARRKSPILTAQTTRPLQKKWPRDDLWGVSIRHAFKNRLYDTLSCDSLRPQRPRRKRIDVGKREERQ